MESEQRQDELIKKETDMLKSYKFSESINKK